MSSTPGFQPPRFSFQGLPREAEDLRREVRAFLISELEQGTFTPRCDAWLTSHSPEFSRKLGKKGWLGLTFPMRYGGGGRSYLERFVLLEETLALGAPVAAHWIADRQTGPLLLSYGSEEQKRRFLPAIARGELYFSIGLSEPDAGSDLAAVKTSAAEVEGGWRVNGTKVWTSQAHLNHYFVVLCRTSPPQEDRHQGLSQLIVDLKSPGVEVRPIPLISGERHFNEVILDDVFVPEEMLVGKLGEGWKQVTSELAFERSGPERLLSTFPLLDEAARLLAPRDPEAAIAFAGLLAELRVARQLSLAVAVALNEGRTPDVEAALVKDLGTRLEGKICEVVRVYLGAEPALGGERISVLLAEALLAQPGFTLRGGTSEILRGIVARGIGAR